MIKNYTGKPKLTKGSTYQKVDCVKLPKLCPKCKQLKDNFGTRKDKYGHLYYKSYCRPCSNKVTKESFLRLREKDPEKYYKIRRHEQLRSKYKIGLKDYEAMLAHQGGVCAICGKENPGKYTFSVDHDHQTGKVRGLLCHHCNKGLGQFFDNPELLLDAINYIQEV